MNLLKTVESSGTRLKRNRDWRIRFEGCLVFNEKVLKGFFGSFLSFVLD
jgi:hypothetical protein